MYIKHMNLPFIFCHSNNFPNGFSDLNCASNLPGNSLLVDEISSTTLHTFNDVLPGIDTKYFLFEIFWSICFMIDELKCHNFFACSVLIIPSQIFYSSNWKSKSLRPRRKYLNIFSINWYNTLKCHGVAE